MGQPPQKVEWAIWGGLAVIALAIVAGFLVGQMKGNALPVYGSLTDFTLTNQDGRAMTLADWRGQVWIADAIFTRCPGQCLLMSAHMKEIQDGLPSGPPIRLVSLTTDPVFDRPAVLKKYAQRFGARDGLWSFLTGDKSALHNLEAGGLKLAVVDKPSDQRESATDLFIHSEKFVLIDKLGRIRGYYDGQESNAAAQVIAAAQTLAGL